MPPPHPNPPDLLNTKLAPPRLRAGLVAREALLARLDAGLDYKLTLLSAPAGFGKTTLARAWMAARYEQDGAACLAWLSLDAGDNDPVRFWRYLINACQTFEPEIGQSALGLLRVPQRPTLEIILTSLINDLANLPHRCILILEDYHLITASEIHAALTFLIDHLPATLQLTMLTRSDPPLPLARLRANQHLFELQAEDLRFSQTETEIFLQEALTFSLPAEVSAYLGSRTEGWAAGLRLTALALQGRQSEQEIAQFLETFSGSHQHISRYLAEEVLATQPESIREFLLQTAFLTRLTGSLCDAVVGRQDSAFILDQLEQANLFLTPLDSSQTWYRYHPLFAEAMHHYARRHLGPARLKALYEKASLWYEASGLLIEAVEAALAAEALDRAAGLINRLIDSYTTNNEIVTLRRWLERLPTEVLYRYPLVCFGYVMAILFTSDRGAPSTAALMQEPLRRAEKQWRAEENWSRLGQLLAFRSLVALWQGDIASTFVLGGQALELLPEEEAWWRGTVLINQGVEKFYAGQFETAQALLRQAHSLCEVGYNEYAKRATLMVMGNICLWRGKLGEAEQIFQRMEVEAGQDLVDQSHALIGLGRLAYERNDLALAGRHIAQVLDISRKHGDALGRRMIDDELVIPASLVLARIQHAAGRSAEATRQLDRMAALSQQYRRLYRYHEVQVEQVRLALRDGNLALVERWVAECARRETPVWLLQQEQEALLFARLLLAQGQVGEALPLLTRWQRDAQSQGRGRPELELALLTALAQAANNRQHQARRSLIPALTQAQAEGYRRLFLDEGQPMADLLQTTLPELTDPTLISYVRSLLADFGRPSLLTSLTTTSSGPAALIEPLSPQEERVLRLLAAGLSNPEIAQELIVSVNTVKTQVKSIYRKLDVHSRDEVGDQARYLNLV